MSGQTALVTTQNPNGAQIAVSSPSADEWRMIREQSQMLIKTGFLPVSIKTPEQAVAIILQGRELGIPTMAALGTINVIQGKPTISPQLMLALINRSGQVENIEITNDPDGATCTMKRKGRTAHKEFFGAKEAAAMGLSGKDNYKKQAATMFRWRAVAACARVVFPDVVLGLYTPDEMGAENLNFETGELIPTAAPNLHTVSEIKNQPKSTTTVKPKTETEDPLSKQIFELCSSLNATGADSIVWKGPTLTEYANELLDAQVKSITELDEERKQVLLGDLQGRLDEIKERAAIEAENSGAIDGEIVGDEAPVINSEAFEKEVF